MASQSSSKSSSNPEFVVRRETISAYFHPPLPTSTFHDLVNKGKIVPFKLLRGFYKLNESLKRLGLKEVESLPAEVQKRSMTEILQLAFTLIDPLIFPMPPWLMTVEALDDKDADHALLLSNIHREELDLCESIQEKLAYFNGVLSAQAIRESDTTEGNSGK